MTTDSVVEAAANALERAAKDLPSHSLPFLNAETEDAMAWWLNVRAEQVRKGVL